jgi:hypothetical protein
MVTTTIMTLIRVKGNPSIAQVTFWWRAQVSFYWRRAHEMTAAITDGNIRCISHTHFLTLNLSRAIRDFFVGVTRDSSKIISDVGGPGGIWTRGFRVASAAIVPGWSTGPVWVFHRLGQIYPTIHVTKGIWIYWRVNKVVGDFSAKCTW